MVFAIVIVKVNTLDTFNSNKLNLGVGQLINHKMGVWDVLSTMWITLGLLKTLTNFILSKFEELCVLVVPTMEAHVRAIAEAHISPKWPTKLIPNQCLLQFILYMKHDNVVMYDVFMWNWSNMWWCGFHRLLQ
jgi:hypothetical protein